MSGYCKACCDTVTVDNGQEISSSLPGLLKANNAEAEREEDGYKTGNNSCRRKVKKKANQKRKGYTRTPTAKIAKDSCSSNNEAAPLLIMNRDRKRTEPLCRV